MFEATMKHDAMEQDELRRFYEEAALEYCRTMPPTEFSETTIQSEQRTITWCALGLIAASRPDVQSFNRISLRCSPGDEGEGRFVTPDHTVVISAEPVPLDADPVFLAESVRPILAVDYVSDDWPRPADVGRLEREAEAGVAYSLVFDALRRTATGYRLQRDSTANQLKEDVRRRIEIPELEIEVAIQDGWMRYWFRGELVQSPAELSRASRSLQQQLRVEKAARVQAEAEIERLRGGS